MFFNKNFKTFDCVQNIILNVEIISIKGNFRGQSYKKQATSKFRFAGTEDGWAVGNKILASHVTLIFRLTIKFIQINSFVSHLNLIVRNKLKAIKKT